MLEKFLKELGAVTGKTYTPAEFAQIIAEAQNADKKSDKSSAKDSEKKTDKKS